MVEQADSVIAAWRQALGTEAVIADAEGLQAYTGAVCASRRQVPCVLRPADADAVREIVRIANQFKARASGGFVFLSDVGTTAGARLSKGSSIWQALFL